MSSCEWIVKRSGRRPHPSSVPGVVGAAANGAWHAAEADLRLGPGPSCVRLDRSLAQCRGGFAVLRIWHDLGRVDYGRHWRARTRGMLPCAAAGPALSTAGGADEVTAASLRGWRDRLRCVRIASRTLRWTPRAHSDVGRSASAIDRSGRAPRRKRLSVWIRDRLRRARRRSCRRALIEFSIWCI